MSQGQDPRTPLAPLWPVHPPGLPTIAAGAPRIPHHPPRIRRSPSASQGSTKDHTRIPQHPGKIPTAPPPRSARIANKIQDDQHIPGSPRMCPGPPQDLAGIPRVQESCQSQGDLGRPKSKGNMCCHLQSGLLTPWPCAPGKVCGPRGFTIRKPNRSPGSILGWESRKPMD